MVSLGDKSGHKKHNDAESKDKSESYNAGCEGTCAIVHCLVVHCHTHHSGLCELVEQVEAFAVTRVYGIAMLSLNFP